MLPFDFQFAHFFRSLLAIGKLVGLENRYRIIYLSKKTKVNELTRFLNGCLIDD